MSKIRNVLLVYKKSLLERQKGGAEMATLPDPIRRRLLQADVENRQSINDCFYMLVRARISFDLISREDLKSDEGFDLVVVVGGDGTFFAASHYVKKTPMVLVNSDPQQSLGLFAACDRTGFQTTLDQIVAGHAKKTVLNRLALTVGSTRMQVINDVLYAVKNPVSMARYTLAVDGTSEEQDSSGVWVSTAAGSTAAVRSAGGELMDLESEKIQYVVREPYLLRRKYNHVKGFAEKEMTIVSGSFDSAVWVDGVRQPIDVPVNGKVILRTPGEPLVLLGYDPGRRAALAGR